MKNMRRVGAVAGAAALALAAGCVSKDWTCPPWRKTGGTGLPSVGKTYWVDGAATNAADTNSGTADRPWKSLQRAGSAKELQPGDAVLVRNGVYREALTITVSGAPGRPLTFAAAPGAKVFVKGSELVPGPWARVSGDPAVKEPYPNAFQNVWKVQLGEEFFVDPPFAASYQDPATRFVSQVFVNGRPLQRIGEDSIYPNEPYAKLRSVGRGLADLQDESFFFDPATQTLYLRIGGEPGWFVIEVGVRGHVLTLSGVHDVVVRGFDVRHNRMPAAQWSMAGLGGCERVVVEACRFSGADFCGLGVAYSTNCVVRNCDLSWNGNTGLNLHVTESCAVEDCTLFFNNYRRFHAGWHCGGMKNIPNNKRAVIRRCEVAYTFAGPGIWFDAGNAGIRIVDNVVHHNEDCGIFFEINQAGGIIADNLVYANGGRGVYVSGSANTWVVNNTVVDNVGGIVAMPREDPFKLRDVRISNNVLVNNAVPAAGMQRGSDLTLYQEPDPAVRAAADNWSDYNVFGEGLFAPAMRPEWNTDHALEQWRTKFGHDQHSTVLEVRYGYLGTGFCWLPVDGFAKPGPLPTDLKWRAADPKHVGAARTRWP